MNNPNHPLPGPDDFDRMELSLFAAVAEAEKKRIRHRRLLAAGATLAVVAGALTTASIATQADRTGTLTANASASQDAAQSEVVYCYAGPNLSSPFVVERGATTDQGAVSHGQNAGGGDSPAAEAVRLCAEKLDDVFWANSGGSTGNGTGTAPPSIMDGAPAAAGLQLQACQRADKAYAVFALIAGDTSETGDFCTAFGMTAPTKGK